MSHKMLRTFIVKVSVLGYFPLYGFYYISNTIYTTEGIIYLMEYRL